MKALPAILLIIMFFALGTSRADNIDKPAVRVVMDKFYRVHQTEIDDYLNGSLSDLEGTNLMSATLALTLLRAAATDAQEWHTWIDGKSLNELRKVVATPAINERISAVVGPELMAAHRGAERKRLLLAAVLLAVVAAFSGLRSCWKAELHADQNSIRRKLQSAASISRLWKIVPIFFPMIGKK